MTKARIAMPLATHTATPRAMTAVADRDPAVSASPPYLSAQIVGTKQCASCQSVTAL